jgi:type I restriction enzyme S subunit
MKSLFDKRKLKYAASLNDESLTESTDPDFELQYVDIGNVDSQGNIHELAVYPFKKAPSRARRQVKHGDVIISTVRTYLQAIAPIKEPETNLIVSTGFAVVRPNSNILNDDYFKYAVRESRFLEEVEARSKGVSYPAINSSELADIAISLPTIEIQQLIADYLDRETTQIDNLIAAKEQMLTLLEEKREALISHAVTRGLDPNVAFKRSGLDWLGDIPQHWNIERAKNLFSVRDERSDNGDEELLSVSHITGVTSRADKQVYMFKAEDMTGYKRCTKGDFVTNTLWGWMGAMGVSPLDGIVSPDYHVYIFKGDLLPEFMELLCRSKPFIAEVVRWSKGVWSSRLRIYPENFFEIRLPVPPKSEQLELIDKVAEEDEKNKELKNALTDSITLLKERRSALITAAVTGQIALEEMTS